MDAVNGVHHHPNIGVIYALSTESQRIDLSGGFLSDLDCNFSSGVSFPFSLNFRWTQKELSSGQKLMINVKNRFLQESLNFDCFF